jgi:hypothetical protein
LRLEEHAAVEPISDLGLMELPAFERLGTWLAVTD